MSDNSQHNDDDRHWEEEEEDVEYLHRTPKSRVVDRRERFRRSSSKTRSPRRSRSRSPLRASSPGLASAIDKIVTEKLDGFLASVSDMMQSREQKPENLEQKVNELKSSQRDLEFQQKANKLKSEGAKFQFLSFSKVRAKVEGIEAVLLEAEKNPNSFSSERLQLMLEEARAAKAMIDHRLEFIGRADGLLGGWKVLTKFEQMMQSEPGKDPEREKMWHAAVKAVDNEKKTKATSSHSFKKPEYKTVKGRSGIFKCSLTP
jgi:hypothetical protein